MAILTQTRLKELLNYDPVNGVFTWIVKPKARVQQGDIAGSVSKSNGYLVIGIDGDTYLAHRLAFLWMEGVIPEFVDHYDHIKTNNSWSNISAATRNENNRNVTFRCDNSSGFTGVYWMKETKRWRACINFNGEKISLGSFAAKDDAIIARKSANQKYGFHKNHGVKVS